MEDDGEGRLCTGANDGQGKAETDKKPAKKVLEERGQALRIQDLIGIGKTLGLANKELREFVREQQEIAREERGRAREARKEEREAAERREEREAEERLRELEYKKAIEVERLRLEHERVVRNSSEFNESRVSSVVVDTSAYKQEKLRIPKFENKQLNNVAKYLEVFESVVKQNGYEEEMWPLSLRTAVTGTKLEEIVELGGSYADIRNEILHAYGQTAEEVWKDLITMKQGGESFRQFCLRVQRHLERFE